MHIACAPAPAQRAGAVRAARCAGAASMQALAVLRGNHADARVFGQGHGLCACVKGQPRGCSCLWSSAWAMCVLNPVGTTSLALKHYLN